MNRPSMLTCCVALCAAILPTVAHSQNKGDPAAKEDPKAAITCEVDGGAIPSARPSAHWRTVSKIKGGIEGLIKIREGHFGCVPSGFNRAIHYLAGPMPGVTVDQLQTMLNDEIGKPGGAEWDPGVANRSTWNGSEFERTRGGTTGDVVDYLKVKEAVVATLKAKGAIKGITSKHVFTGASSNSKNILEQVRDAVAAGAAVEVHITNHFSMVGEVVQHTNGDWGVILADDKTQGDPKEETGPRGPFFFDANGDCYTVDAVTGAKKERKTKLFGIIIETADK